MTRLLFGVLASLFAGGQLMAQAHVGQYEQADIAYGSTLYATYCVVCHGESGDLFPGVNLRSGVFRHAASDRDLRGILLDGIPGTTMVAGAYEEPELVALIAYLRNMDAEVGGVTLGDATRGQALFQDKGDCGSCHRVAGQGPREVIVGRGNAAVAHRAEYLLGCDADPEASPGGSVAMQSRQTRQ